MFLVVWHQLWSLWVRIQKLISRRLEETSVWIKGRLKELREKLASQSSSIDSRLFKTLDISHDDSQLLPEIGFCKIATNEEKGVKLDWFFNHKAYSLQMILSLNTDQVSNLREKSLWLRIFTGQGVYLHDQNQNEKRLALKGKQHSFIILTASLNKPPWEHLSLLF